MAKCKYVNCDERAVKDEVCGPHHNDLLAYRKKEKAVRPLSAAEKKRSQQLQKEIDEENVDEMIDLDWWYEQYGDQDLPAKFMNRYYLRLVTWDEELEEGPPDAFATGMAKLSAHEAVLLSARLKDLVGTGINKGTHVWMFTGSKHYQREGTHNHFRCVPVDEMPKREG